MSLLSFWKGWTGYLVGWELIVATEICYFIWNRVLETLEKRRQKKNFEGGARIPLQNQTSPPRSQFQLKILKKKRITISPVFRHSWNFKLNYNRGVFRQLLLLSFRDRSEFCCCQYKKSTLKLINTCSQTKQITKTIFRTNHKPNERLAFQCLSLFTFVYLNYSTIIETYFFLQYL